MKYIKQLLSQSQLVRREDGVSAVEFGLILPLLAALLMGTIEFGMMFFARNAAQNAARDIVRQIATNRLPADNAAAEAAKQTAVWVTPHQTVTVSQSAPGTATNQITVNISFPALKAAPTGFLSYFYGSTTLDVKAIMKQEVPL
jgi:Flp pilus assembly protein TadG